MHRTYRRRNAITTFTTEQAIYVGVGGALVLGTLGYLLYKAGQNAQQIADLQSTQQGQLTQTGT